MDIKLEKYIREHFTYHPNGTITRDDRKGSNGSYDKDGYLILKIKKKQFKAHRVAWFLNYGEFPNGEIDHINRNRTDNRIENLRVCTRLQNNRNKAQKLNPDTGTQGIYVDKCTKGLKAIYTFRVHGKTYRERSLEKAIEKRRCLNEQIDYNSN